MLKFIKHFWPQIILVIVVSILCFRNFTPNTFLTGWDNLHPEFNILANIKRSIFSTWQEYQGLGLLAGMAHSADLVRQLFILPLTYVLPINLIRYVWHFSMLFLGTLGLYQLSVYLTKNKYSSLIAALFYLLNFGTVQYFQLPFDPYSTFWGFFPWLIYALFQKNYFWLFVINLLATPSFYVQTLFVVYFICVSIILALDFKQVRHNLNTILLIIAVNSFWLFPNIYFTLTRVSITQNSMQNLMTTDQFIEQNLYRGNLRSFALLQNQYYDISQAGQPLMLSWHTHFNNPLTFAIGVLFTALALLAIFSPNKYKKYFLLILIFGLIGFLSDTPPFNFINSIIRQLPLINQIFRNSFTKLLVPVVFSLSVLISISLDRFKKINLAFVPIILFLSWPSFGGFFINPQMRNDIPQKYFELTKYLNTQDSSKRILDLPQYNYWGWYSYTWGSTGSGFLWYGIDQPVTNRTFDVWDNNLENLYWQLRYALISRNSAHFQNVLQKYNISYILFDPNIFFAESFNSGKVILESEKLLDETPNLQLEKQFGDIKLYAVLPTKNNIATFLSLPNLDVPDNFNYLDQAFANYSHYQTTPSKTFIDSFPNVSLFSNHPQQTINLASISKLNPTPRWVNCLSAEPSMISAQNQEVTHFYNCGDTLDLSRSYLIKVDSKNFVGRPLLFKVFSLTDHRLIIDTRIDPQQKINYFVVPPVYPFDEGIGINFSSQSLSTNRSINQINSVTITSTDWLEISDLHFNTPTPPSTPNPVDFHQFNQTLYRVNLANNSNSVLTLFQSYSPGWTAFYFDGLKPVIINDHFKVNNWANGWNIKNINNQVFYIFFWPQLLEFLGFGIILCACIPVLLPYIKHK